MVQNRYYAQVWRFCIPRVDQEINQMDHVGDVRNDAKYQARPELRRQ